MDKSLDEIIRAQGSKFQFKSPQAKPRKRFAMDQRPAPVFPSNYAGPRRHNQFQNKPTNILVGGLALSVSVSDLKELFQPFGHGKDVYVKKHFNAKGRFLGSAEVTMPNESAAQRAIKTYDQVPLDGSRMTIVSLGRRGAFRNPNLNQRLGRRDQDQGKPHFHREKASGKEEKKAVPSADQLDQEMEEYMEQTRSFSSQL